MKIWHFQINYTGNFYYGWVRVLFSQRGAEKSSQQGAAPEGITCIRDSEWSYHVSSVTPFYELLLFKCISPIFRFALF